MNRNNDFAMENNDSLLSASLRIRDLLKIKYHGDEYVADTTKGSDSDSKLQTIIGKVNNATKLIYATELSFTNTAKTNTEKEIEKDDREYRKQIDNLVKEQNNLVAGNEKLSTNNETINNEQESITYNINRLNEELLISPSKDKTNKLNKLEKILLSNNDKLLNNNNQIVNNNNRIQVIENSIREYEDRFNEEKDLRDTNRPVNYVRGVNAYIDASNNFKSIELLMKEIIYDIQKLLPVIGYCQPETITTFYGTIKDFDNTNESLKKRLYSKYKAEVAKDLPTIAIELKRIYASYDKLSENIAIFYKSVNKIHETYNYIQSSANSNSHNDSNYTDVNISNTEKKELSGGSYLTRIRNLH